MTGKGEHIIKTDLKVKGQSKGPKTKVHFNQCSISGAVVLPLQLRSVPLHSLLRLIAGTHGGVGGWGGINAEKPLPHLFPHAALGATTSRKAPLSELMALASRMKKKRILIIGLGDTRGET